MNAITLTIGEKNIVWCCDLNVVNCIVGFVCYYIHHCFEDDHPCRWQAVLFQLKARANSFFFFTDTLDSCVGRCGYGTDAAYTCQCNPACERYGDCCSDYLTVCKGED